MGYDLNKFVDIQDIGNHLRCILCSLVLQDPLQSACEHNFCQKCITIHLQSSNHCPHYDEDSVSVKSDKKKSPLRKMSFRKIIGKSPKDKLPTLKLSDLKTLPQSVLDELNSLKVNCDFHTNGCKSQLTLSTLGEHTLQCTYGDVEQVKSENKPVEIESKQVESKQIEQKNKPTEPEETKVDQSSEQESNEEKRVESVEMDAQLAVKRKDSENKSVNGELKLVSEEEVGSDDFVVIPKNTNSTKSTESVQTNNSSDPAMISGGESKENIAKPNEEASGVTDKKKKKKKKKNKANKQDEDAVSLDTGSLKAVDTNSDQGSKAQSKESLVETEEIRRALRDAETKSDNLRLINNQLLGQIKQMKEEKEEFINKLQSQVGKGTEIDELKAKLQQFEKENKSQQLRIIQLLDNNEQMNKFIVTLRDEQAQLKERYNATLNDVQQISKLVKTCKQEVK